MCKFFKSQSNLLINPPKFLSPKVDDEVSLCNTQIEYFIKDLYCF